MYGENVLNYDLSQSIIHIVVNISITHKEDSQ